VEKQSSTGSDPGPPGRPAVLRRKSSMCFVVAEDRQSNLPRLRRSSIGRGDFELLEQRIVALDRAVERLLQFFGLPGHH